MAACGITHSDLPETLSPSPPQSFEIDFAGSRFVVEPGVFEPGPLSAPIVDVLVRGCVGVNAPVVADVGTGCGALAIAFALRRPDATVYAMDISTEAAACAAANAQRLRAGNVSVFEGSLLEPLAQQGVKLNAIVAALPYVPNAVAGVKELLRPDRWRGPRAAIVGKSSDGLGLLRELVRQANELLHADGFIVLEMDDWQTSIFAQEFSGDYRVEIPAMRHYVTLWRPGAELRPVL